MSFKTLGIDPFVAASTTFAHEEGLETVVKGNGDDPTVADTTGIAICGTATVIKYVVAGGTITAGDAVMIDITAAVADRAHTVVRTAAATDVVEGIALVSATVGQGLFIVTKGVVKGANVADAVVAGARVTASASAGRLDAVPATAAGATDFAAGRRAQALIDASASNFATVILRG